MRDVQNEPDLRRIPLRKVCVTGLRYPIDVLDKANGMQTTTGTADLFVNLPRHFKGTHMSRFVEIFHAYRKDLSMKRFLAMLEEVRRRLDAERAFASVKFPFFIEKTAPVSGQPGLMCYDCGYEGEVFLRDPENGGGISRVFTVSVEVPVTTVCPCSKAISRHGAHNQRGRVRVRVRNTGFFWIEDIISFVESCASCGLYSVLKRKDEKFVTEHAYENPRFAEDLVREVYAGLKNAVSLSPPLCEKPFLWFSVEAENEESIHRHNAYAYAEYTSP